MIGENGKDKAMPAIHHSNQKKLPGQFEELVRMMPPRRLRTRCNMKPPSKRWIG